MMRGDTGVVAPTLNASASAADAARTVKMVETLVDFMADIALRFVAAVLILSIFFMPLPASIGLYDVFSTGRTPVKNVTMPLLWYCPVSFF